jgi:hypothetical protein
MRVLDADGGQGLEIVLLGSLHCLEGQQHRALAAPIRAQQGRSRAAPQPRYREGLAPPIALCHSPRSWQGDSPSVATRRSPGGASRRARRRLPGWRRAHGGHSGLRDPKKFPQICPLPARKAIYLLGRCGGPEKTGLSPRLLGQMRRRPDFDCIHTRPSHTIHVSPRHEVVRDLQGQKGWQGKVRSSTPGGSPSPRTGLSGAPCQQRNGPAAARPGRRERAPPRPGTRRKDACDGQDPAGRG